MSRNLGGSSGGPRSFGGGSSSGSRSFGGSHGGGPRRVGGGGSSGGSYGSSDGISGLDAFGFLVAIIELLAILGSFLGIPGLLITILIVVDVVVFFHNVVAGWIILGVGAILTVPLLKLWKKYRKTERVVVDKELIEFLSGEQKKYKRSTIYSRRFYTYLMDDLRSKHLLADDGYLSEEAEEQAINEFDDTYNRYIESKKAEKTAKKEAKKKGK